MFSSLAPALVDLDIHGSMGGDEVKCGIFSDAFSALPDFVDLVFASVLAATFSGMCGTNCII